MPKGPFTDDMVKHAFLTVQTQRGIIEVAEKMAEILAEAGRASNKAVGDSPAYAVRRWSDVIRDRALELLNDDPPSPMQKKLRALRKELAK